MKGDTMVAV